MAGEDIPISRIHNLISSETKNVMDCLKWMSDVTKGPGPWVSDTLSKQHFEEQIGQLIVDCTQKLTKSPMDDVKVLVVSNDAVVKKIMLPVFDAYKWRYIHVSRCYEVMKYIGNDTESFDVIVLDEVHPTVKIEAFHAMLRLYDSGSVIVGLTNCDKEDPARKNLVDSGIDFIIKKPIMDNVEGAIGGAAVQGEAMRVRLEAVLYDELGCRFNKIKAEVLETMKILGDN